MAKQKKYSTGIYNTSYDELPEFFAIFSPYMWIWLLEIVLMMGGGGWLMSMIASNFFPAMPIISPIGAVVITLCIVTPNFMIVYGYNYGVVLLQLLCSLYVIGAIPHFFFDHALHSFVPLVCGIFSLWITRTAKFKVFMLHRVKMGEWRREQLEKNKVRREVIRERKAEEKAKRKKAD